MRLKKINLRNIKDWKKQDKFTNFILMIFFIAIISATGGFLQGKRFANSEMNNISAVFSVVVRGSTYTLKDNKIFRGTSRVGSYSCSTPTCKGSVSISIGFFSVSVPFTTTCTKETCTFVARGNNVALSPEQIKRLQDFTGVSTEPEKPKEEKPKPKTDNTIASSTVPVSKATSTPVVKKEPLPVVKQVPPIQTQTTPKPTKLKEPIMVLSEPKDTTPNNGILQQLQTQEDSPNNYFLGINSTKQNNIQSDTLDNENNNATSKDVNSNLIEKVSKKADTSKVEIKVENKINKQERQVVSVVSKKITNLLSNVGNNLSNLGKVFTANNKKPVLKKIKVIENYKIIKTKRELLEEQGVLEANRLRKYYNTQNGSLALKYESLTPAKIRSLKNYNTSAISKKETSLRNNLFSERNFIPKNNPDGFFKSITSFFINLLGLGAPTS